MEDWPVGLQVLAFIGIIVGIFFALLLLAALMERHKFGIHY